MKKTAFFSGLVLSVVILLLTACRAPAPAATTPPAPAAAPAATEWQKVIDAATKEGKVTIYASAISPKAMTAITAGFKQDYGITVEWVPGTGAASLERIKTEQAAKAYTGDILFSGPSIWPVARDNKWVVPTELPVAQEKGVWNVEPYSFDPQGRTFIVILPDFPPGGISVHSNTTLVPKDKEPQSWYDLLNPAWKGKLLMWDPSVSSTPNHLIAMRKSTPPFLTLEYWQKLADQKPVFTRSYGDLTDKVAKGEFPISLFGLNSYALPLIEAKMPIKQLYLKEGHYQSMMSVAQIVNAPHPNATRLFLNWSMTQRGQLPWTQSEQNLSLRKDVPDFRPDFLRPPAGVPILRNSWEQLAIVDSERELPPKTFGLK